MPVDALRTPFYTSRYSEGPMFRGISLIWEIQAKYVSTTNLTAAMTLRMGLTTGLANSDES
jgi:hypothetical protein